MVETECRSKQHIKNLNCVFFWFLLIYSCFDKGSSTKRKSVYATMPIGFIRSKSLALYDWRFRCLERRKEEASIHAFVLFPSLTLERKRRGKERAGALIFLFQTPLVAARRSSPLTESLEHARQAGDQGRFVASVSLSTVAVPLLKKTE